MYYEDYYDDYEDKYAGTWAHDVEGYDDDTIDAAFDGGPRSVLEY